ncbi:MAG TPA: hypothetical protein VJZ71_14155 [Phycisphaerae bacterium]|nr:hypothetical protein [Phycisphaerae bacterium]
MIDFEVSRPVGRCVVSGREFAEGELFHSVLFETPQGFERRDYSGESWQGPPEGALCCFQTRLPKREEKRRTFVDDDALLTFFVRLADCTEEAKLRFRFVLSLILLRKRLLKYERTIRDGEREFWEMRCVRDKSSHKVFNPVLSDTEIQELTGELGAILAGGAAGDLQDSDWTESGEVAAADSSEPRP